MAKVIVTGFVASSDYIPVYGRAVLGEDDVRTIFDHLDTKHVPIIGNHDERNVIDARVVSRELRQTPGGGLGIWTEVEVDEDQVAAYHGWSIGWFEDNSRSLKSDSRPAIKFGADAAHFSDEERDQVVAVLGRQFQVVGGRYYQLGIDPPATVALVLLGEMIKALPAAGVAHLLFEGLRHLLPHGARTVPSLFKFSLLREEGRSEARGVLETGDPEMLRTALAGLRSLADSPAGHYEMIDGTWRPVGATRRPAKRGARRKRRSA